MVPSTCSPKKSRWTAREMTLGSPTWLSRTSSNLLDAPLSFGRICNINAIYNIFPDGDSNPNPQNSSQADKYLTNMAVTDPTIIKMATSRIDKFSARRTKCRSPMSTRIWWNSPTTFLSLSVRST